MKNEISQIKKLLSALDTSEDVNINLNSESPFEIGQKYFIRTVTHYYTGECVSITGKFITLDTAAWIADTGRFTQAIANGLFSEVEPIGNGLLINTDSIIDAIPVKFKLPTEQK